MEGGIHSVRDFASLQSKYNSFLLYLIILKYNYIGEDCKPLANKSLNNSSLKFGLSTDSNQDVALKLAQERAEIVAKYDRVSIHHYSLINFYFQKYK